VARRVRDAAGRVIEELEQSAAGGRSATAGVAAARELADAADAALQAAVDRARAAGDSWRKIGDVLDTTRQAAFQRFGHPVNPGTGEPIVVSIPPGVTDHALAVVDRLSHGRWEDVRRDFAAPMRERLDADTLARGWVQTVQQVGQLERTGDPAAVDMGDGNVVVEVPLHFEAGDRTGRVSFNADGQIIGLFLRPAAP
jgi:hypothetical protein